MISERELSKGQTISCYKPRLIFDSSSSFGTKLFDGITFCKGCGRAMIDVMKNDEDTGLVMSELKNLPLFAASEIYSSMKHGGKKRSHDRDGDIFCSAECEINWLGCSFFYQGLRQRGRRKLSDFVSEIYGESRKNVETTSLLLSAILFGNVMGYDGVSDHRLLSLLHFLMKQKDDKRQGEVDDKILECWTLLKNSFDSSSHEIDECIEKLSNSPLELMSLQRSIETLMHPISVPHPIATHLRTNLLKQNDSQLSATLSLIGSPLMDPIFSDNKIKHVGERNAKRIKKSSSSDKLLRWRQAVRLVQVLSDSSFCEEDWNKHNDTSERSFYNLISRLKREYIAFCPEVSRLTHSCVPNGMIEGTASIANPNKINEIDPEEGTQPVLISLIALQDIRKGEVLTISKIQNLEDSVEERAISLRQIFGNHFKCKCIRCRWERVSNTGEKFEVRKENIDSYKSDIPLFSSMELKSLGDLAMQQARYSDACAIYDEMLRLQPYNSDVLHARCATFLERGMFREAQRMWRKANDICGGHEGISLHVRKQEAYEPVLGIGNTISSVKISTDMFIDLLDRECFLTTQPILTKEECSLAIGWAEEAARLRENGWTTSRHYAVPTTDIPIHEVPNLLNFFNQILATRLRPLLALQYGSDEVGDEGQYVFIHDAFIVRYDADGGQKHLPLHRDQSTHSFTIALNSPDEYDGGGTWLAPLGRAVRPSLGGALSFRGDKILHGGDPIVSGRRYIIVAFCFISKDNKNDDEKCRGTKFTGVFDKYKDKKEKEGTEFTFGFFNKS